MTRLLLFGLCGAALLFLVVYTLRPGSPTELLTNEFTVPGQQARGGLCTGAGGSGHLIYDITADVPVTVVIYNPLTSQSYSNRMLACDSGAQDDYGPCDMDWLRRNAPANALEGGLAEAVTNARLDVATRGQPREDLTGVSACYAVLSTSDTAATVKITISEY